MKPRWAARSPRASDDGLGARPITPGYVDDVNAMIPLEDVEFFLASFRSHAGPLGAVLNAQKTRILTSTSGSSILPRLRATQPFVAASLKRAINTYSVDGMTPVKLVRGIRILGVPVGSPDFCKEFVTSHLNKTDHDITAITSGLHDK